MKTFKSVFAATSSKEPKVKTEKQPKQPKAKDKTKKDKSKAKGKEKVEPKKRGRPSNAELAEKARIQKEADIAFRKELLERQKSVASGSLPVVTSSMSVDEVNVHDPNWVPPWPVFLPGQRIESIFKRVDGKTEKGTVGKDDIHSAFIRVSWDDGSSQYAAKLALKLIVKKTYEKVFSTKSSKKAE
jgi:hypothetical protein